MQNYLFSKFFLNLPNNKHKLFALMDTGSAISLFRESLIIQLLSPEEILRYKRPAGVSITSFTHHPVPIVYDIVLPCQFYTKTKNVFITFRVFKETPNYPILIGQDAMRLLKMDISYSNKTVEIFYPIYASLETIDTTSSSAFTASAFISLQPKETKNIIFQPHPLCYIKNNTTVLIENSSIPQIHVFPTKYNSYSSQNIPYIACVSNLSNEKVTGYLNTNLSLLEDFNFLNRFNKKEDFDNLPQTKFPALPYEYNDHNLPSFSIQESLPKNNINGQQKLKSYLLLTPHQSIHSQTKPFQNESKIDPSEHDPTLQKIKATLNDLKPLEDERPNSPPLEMPEDFLKPSGYEIPDNLQPSVAELLNIERFDKKHRSYINDIFIHKYPTIVALHSYDIGNLSKTLGYYTIKLKDNETLPTFRKIYFLNAQDAQHMLDITNFLIKFNVIERCSHRDRIAHLMASPGYLISKTNKLASPRLVIDYTLINQVLKTSPPTIPSITAVLQSLRDQAIFSSIDLTSAFYSITLSPDCRHLTRFATQTGSYTFKSLPMGINLAPQCLAEIAHRMIHMRPILDENGQPIFEEENVVKMVNDALPGVHIFYDDVLMTSKMYPTYEETIKNHYKLVERVMERLAFHRAKISIEKSHFGKFSLKFLGWIIYNNFLLPDPERTKKLLATKFPTNIKAMRSFLGLMNTLRTVLPHDFLYEMNILNPLTSSTTPYSPTNNHLQAFEKLKTLLTSQPIYSNIIDPNLDKVLFVDASDKGCYSAVLGQLVPPKNDQYAVPSHLLLDDKVDQIIFSHRLCFEPAPLYLHHEYIPRSKLNPPFQILPFKDPAYLNHDFLGYTEETHKNSCFHAIRSVQYVYGNALLTFDQIKTFIKEKFHKHIIKIKLLTDFNNNQDQLKLFLKPLNDNILPIDDNLHMITLLAQLLCRPIIVISSLPKHENNQIFKFENNIQKPPIVLGLHIKNNTLIFLPYFINKQASFPLSEIKDRFQIVTFLSKSISPKDYSKDIMHKELFGLMSALATLKPLIGQSNLLVLTDSKPLFLLYTNPVTQSSSKLCRWGLKLSSEYHNLKLRFISTRHNLSDFLTRDFNIKPPDLIRIPLKNIYVPNLNDYIDPYTTFTIEEWKTFVKNHEHLITIKPETKTVSVNFISKSINNMNKVIDPLKHLHDKMSHANIIKEQEKEFPNIINYLITQPDMEAIKAGKTFKLQDGMLYSYENNLLRVLLPESLEGIFISFTHLAHNHLGVAGMTAALKHLDFPRKTFKIKHLAERCYGCALQNLKTTKYLLGSYPTPDFPFQYIHCDLLENLPPNKSYEHILVIACPLSKFLLCYPLKNKTSPMAVYHLIYNLYQFTNLQYIITDNGPIFNSKEFLTPLATLNIKKIRIASLHPASNGFCEAYVKKVKYALKKTLTSHDEYQWLDILPILIKNFNSTGNPPTNLSPLQILHGETSIMAEKALTDRPPHKLYPLLENIKTQVEAKQQETLRILEIVKNAHYWKKINDNIKNNVNKTAPNFKEGDYCFTKDKKIIPGTTRPLKSLYSRDPCVIMETKPTSALVRRLGDTFTTVYSYNDIKKYSPLDPTFSTLPQSVRDILINDFENLNKNHYTELRKYSKLDLPNNEPLFEIKTPEESEVITEHVNPDPSQTNHLSQSSVQSPESVQLTPEKLFPPRTLSKENKTKKDKTFVRITRSMAVNHSDSDSENDEDNNTKTVHFN